MTEQTKNERQAEALTKLRAEFQPHHISKKPNPTKAQNDALKANRQLGQHCRECGGWHQLEVKHLEYVGHAALTQRLLDVDPLWNWKPLALDNGLPSIDRDGGLWIELTVAGMTRLGYGDAGDKTGPNAMKERIGDALRNAGMRFGMALELWHKGVLETEPERFEVKAADKWIMKAEAATDAEELAEVWKAGVAEFMASGDKASYDAFKAAVSARGKELKAGQVLPGGDA